MIVTVAVLIFHLSYSYIFLVSNYYKLELDLEILIDWFGNASMDILLWTMHNSINWDNNTKKLIDW